MNMISGCFLDNRWFYKSIFKCIVLFISTQTLLTVTTVWVEFQTELRITYHIPFSTRGSNSTGSVFVLFSIHSSLTNKKGILTSFSHKDKLKINIHSENKFYNSFYSDYYNIFWWPLTIWAQNFYVSYAHQCAKSYDEFLRKHSCCWPECIKTSAKRIKQ